MVHGKNYVEFCNKVTRRVFYHKAYIGDTSGHEDQARYNNTIQFYEQVFLIQAPTMVWPPASV